MTTYIRNLMLNVRRGGEEGATAVEYGIMVAAIAAVIIALVIVIGKQTKEGFKKVRDEMTKSDAVVTNTTC